MTRFYFKRAFHTRPGKRLSVSYYALSLLIFHYTYMDFGNEYMPIYEINFKY